MAKGLSNRQIATAFGISERTVERHLSAIYQALDVDRRSGALTRAIELGLVG
jgi:DNA-binding NarL/FixJ family response regulator